MKEESELRYLNDMKEFKKYVWVFDIMANECRFTKYLASHKNTTYMQNITIVFSPYLEPSRSRKAPACLIAL